MLKKFSKFLLVVLVIFLISSSSLVCLADETEGTSNNVTSTDTSENTTSTTPETYKGNLYLFGNDVLMDKYVDGNVYILGNNVNITGQVNGNLYILAKNISFNKSVIRYSIFACADYVYYNGGTYEGDLYVATKDLEMTYDSYVTGNIKAIGANVILKSAVGGNVDLLCGSLNLGEGSYIPMLYGDLNYSSSKEISIPENALLGSSNYSSGIQVLLIFILIVFATCIVTSAVIYIITKKCTSSNFSSKLFNSNLSVINLLKALGVGLAFILASSVLFMALLLTRIGIIIAIIITALFIIVLLTAIPLFTVSITNSIIKALKKEKTYIFYIILSLTNILLLALILLPALLLGVLGIIISLILNFLILLISIGLVVMALKPCKKVPEEKETEENDSL